MGESVGCKVSGKLRIHGGAVQEAFYRHWVGGTWLSSPRETSLAIVILFLLSFLFLFPLTGPQMGIALQLTTNRRSCLQKSGRESLTEAVDVISGGYHQSSLNGVSLKPFSFSFLF